VYHKAIMPVLFDDSSWPRRINLYYLFHMSSIIVQRKLARTGHGWAQHVGADGGDGRARSDTATHRDHLGHGPGGDAGICAFFACATAPSALCPRARDAKMRGMVAWPIEAWIVDERRGGGRRGLSPALRSAYCSGLLWREITSGRGRHRRRHGDPRGRGPNTRCALDAYGADFRGKCVRLG
jgi:hypothetical protein